MTRYLRFVLRQKRQVKHIVTLKFLRTLKTSRPQVEKGCSSRYRSKQYLTVQVSLNNVYCDKFVEISNLMIFLIASAGH